MSLALVVTGLVLELVDPDLRALGVGDDLGGHRHLGKLRRVGHQVVTVDEQDGLQRQLVTGRTGELLDLDHVALGDLVLLAAGLDDRVHRTRTPVLLLADGPCANPRTKSGAHKCWRTTCTGRQEYAIRIGLPKRGVSGYAADRR